MKVILIILGIVASHILHAQDSTSNKFNVKLGANFQSTLHYYGRTDSLKSSGFFPQVEFWSNEKLYVSATPVFINNDIASMQYAGTVATLGFINSTEKNFSHFYLMKPFYKEKTLVQSALKAQAGFSNSFLSKFINITVGIDGKLSDKFDIGTMAGIDHVWRHQFADQSILVIDPTATLNAGTQQFSETYYKQSQFTFFPGTLETISVKQFSILSYEFSIPIIYRKGKLMFTATPAYVIPKNLIVVDGNGNASERGNEMFYFMSSVKLNF